MTRCRQIDCIKQATFNYKGLTGQYCKTHKMEGMEDVHSRKCQHENCNKQPSYGFQGQIPTHCTKHKLQDMINTISPRCEFVGCNKQPNFGFRGKQATHCVNHKMHDMEDVHNRKCQHENCTKRPSYGFQKNKPTHCAMHKLQNMLDTCNPLCQYMGCNTRSSFGFLGKKATHCAKHRTADQIDLVNTLCSVYLCNTQTKIKKDGNYYCARCFAYCFPEQSKSKRYKKKEMYIKEHVQQYVEEDKVQFDKQIPQGCSKRRPDILIKLPMHNIIIEIDENQHKSYDTTCEIQRLNDIYTDLGSMPLIMIRFNPDQFQSDNIKYKSCFSNGSVRSKKSINHQYEDISHRLQVLKQTIEKYIQYIPEEQIEYKQIDLFYDDY